MTNPAAVEGNRGPGPARIPATLMLLSGLDGTGIMFRPLVCELEGHCRTRTVSCPQDGSLGYRELTGLVQSRLPREDFFLLGESFSGPIAIAVAARRPPGLRGIVLCATFVRNPSAVFPSSLSFLVVAPLFMGWPVAAKMRVLTSGRARDEIRGLMTEVKREAQPPVLAARTREALRVDVVEEFRALPYPMLHLCGAGDIVVPRRNLEFMRRVRPDLRVPCLDTSHLVLQEKPGEAAASILAFMRGAPPRGPLRAPESRRRSPAARCGR